MKIIDCFTFFNELDLLEFRLKLLDPYVDHFIIAESNLTHSGLPKPYHFRADEKRYQPWLHKITYIPIVQQTEGLVFNKEEVKYNPTSASWKLENEQRDALSVAGTMANDDDLIITGDLDEIPDPSMLKKLKLGDSPVALSLLFHYYFMNCQNSGVERWWNGSIISTGKQFKGLSPQILRDNRNNYPVIKKAGWHFSYLGGLEKIKYKLRSFAHTEFNKEEYLQDEHILQSLEEGKDILKRPGVSFRFVSLYYYPSYLRTLMLQYPAFIHQKTKDTVLDKIYYSTLRTLSALS
jgi:beta-1,4-mannosyl-glycoprotein beta-1,4-N-acetylglucosaminyltransferase